MIFKPINQVGGGHSGCICIWGSRICFALRNRQIFFNHHETLLNFVLGFWYRSTGGHWSLGCRRGEKVDSYLGLSSSDFMRVYMVQEVVIGSLGSIMEWWFCLRSQSFKKEKYVTERNCQGPVELYTTGTWGGCCQRGRSPSRTVHRICGVSLNSGRHLAIKRMCYSVDVSSIGKIANDPSKAGMAIDYVGTAPVRTTTWWAYHVRVGDKN